MACAGDDQVQASDRSEYASDISFLKFKYGLQNFFTSVKILKDKETSARQDFQLLMEKHKKLEAAHGEECFALHSEVTMGNEARHKLETEVQDLRREASLKGTEIKCLKEDLKALMDARNELAESLKASNYSLQCKLEEKTHDLVVLLEKHNRHSLLLEAIEKEAFSVKQAVDETNACIQQKEEEVFSFQRKLLKVLEFESNFLERIDQLEKQLRTSSSNLCEKNEIILALEKRLEAAVNDHTVEAELAIYKETLEMKDSLILMLRQEKEVLLENLKNHETIMEKLQPSITQQDQIVLKYQQEVLALQKDLDALKNSLIKTERGLLEATEENRKLTDAMQDQRHGFDVQAQLWEEARVALEAKITELEGRLIENELLLQKKALADKATVTNKDQGRFLLDCNDATTPSKVSLTRDLDGQQIVTHTCQNCSKDLPGNTSREFKDTVSNSQPLETFSELEDIILPCEAQLDQTSHLFSGNDYVPEACRNKETAKSISFTPSILKSSMVLSTSEGKESGPLNVELCEHLINSQPVKRSAGGNALNVDSILERLGRPISRTKESSDPIPTGMILLEPPKLLHAIKPHVQGSEVEAPAHRIDEAQPTLLDPPITVEQMPTVELDELDIRQQEEKIAKLEAQMIVSEPPQLSNHSSLLVNVGKVDDEGEHPKQELNEQQEKRTNLKSGAQLMLLEAPESLRPMKLVASYSNEREDPASKGDGKQQQQEQTQMNSESQLMPLESSKLSTWMPSMLDEPGNGGKATANEADEQQQEETHLNSEAQVEQPESAKMLDKSTAAGRSSADEADEQQPDKTCKQSELQVGLIQEEKGKFFTFGSAACLEVGPSSDVPPSPSNINSGKEGFSLEAADEPIPETRISERCFIIGKNPQIEPKSSKKKAFVPTSANECLCNMPPYGYMVNCKVCGTHFHAACIQLEGIKPGESYICASCKQQPNRKRRQVQIIMESK